MGYDLRHTTSTLLPSLKLRAGSIQRDARTMTRSQIPI